MKLTEDYLKDCKKCTRLDGFLTELKDKYPDYHNQPVLPFGDKNPDLLIVGLAPGMHGANATGRPFTGDYAGILLYQTLYEFGFANQPEATNANDGLELINCRITNAVKCLPPQNKPTSEEINTCNEILQAELLALPTSTVILALGGIAHKSIIKTLNLRQVDYKFGHNATHHLLDGRYLIDSYHCSRYNTQTKRLTVDSFKDVFKNVKKIIQNTIKS